MMDEQVARSTSAARLGRLPMAWPQYSILLMMVAFIAVEGLDLGLTGVIIPPLKGLLHWTPGQIGLFGLASTLGVVVGLIPSGMLQDVIGRKRIAIAGMVVFCVFTGSTGFVSATSALILFRFLAGLGAGAVFPVPYTYLAEFMPTVYRGRGVAWGQMGLVIGYIISPLVALLVYSIEPAVSGWRVIAFLDFIPLVLLPLLIKNLPESPRWLEAKGFHDRARVIVEQMESYYTRREQALPPIPSAEAVQSQASVWSFLHGVYIGRWIAVTLMYIGAFIPFYITLTYLPTIMTDRGYALIGGVFFAVITNVINLFGNLLQGYLADVWGRRPTIFTFSLVGVVAAVLFGYATNYPFLVILTALVGFCVLPIFLVIKLYCGECFPTDMRATASGTAETVSRFVGGVLPIFFVPFLLKGVGITGLYWFAGIALLVLVSGVAYFSLRETKGMSMEQTSSA